MPGLWIKKMVLIVKIVMFVRIAEIVPVKFAPVKQKTNKFNWVNIALHYRVPVKQKKIHGFTI